MELPFHSYRLRSKKAAQTRLLNCYAQQTPPEGRGPVLIQGMAGTVPFVTISTSPQRAAISFNGLLYSVARSSFLSVGPYGAKTTIGTLPVVESVDIGKIPGQFGILVEPTLYVYDGASLTEGTDVDFVARGAKRMAVM